MSLLTFLFGEKPKSASMAKERLQLIIAREKGSGNSSPDFLPKLRDELVAVISKYVQIDDDGVKFGELAINAAIAQGQDAPAVTGV